MPFIVGDWIEHPKFGQGQIAEDRGASFAIYFVSDGEKIVQKDFVTKAGLPPHPNFTFADPKHAKRKTTAQGSYRPAMSFEHLIERFTACYPNGFEDSGFDRDERQYKIAAVEEFSQYLNKREMQGLIKAVDYSEIAKRVKHCASKTNLIFRQELMDLNDGLKDIAAQKDFSLALLNVLYEHGNASESFERYISVLGQIGCSKWTIATYFQFLATRGGMMFMKPQVSKALAASVGISLNYTPIPSWLTFQKLNETAVLVRKRLEESGMKPRDGIDVQSFMYVAWAETK